MIKVGVIGCGTIANSAHIPSYLNCPDAEIKYFCDIIPERAQAAVEKYGCGIAVVDYHDVLADPEITAVSVCTPNRMHPIRSGRRSCTIPRMPEENSRISPYTAFSSPETVAMPL